jgi:hypothetical protein
MLMNEGERVIGERTLWSLQARLLALKKALASKGDNPFEALSCTRSLLADLEQCKAIESYLHDQLARLDTDCAERRLEFWSGFSKMCSAQGWTLLGSTNRRLASSGIFVELEGDNVVIEELDLRLRPDPSSVAKAIAPTISAIRKWSDQLDEFRVMLERGYAMVPGVGGKPLEAVYRATVFCAQRAGFWKALKPSAIVAIVRPVFRACLSDLVSKGVTTSGGCRIVFGTASPGIETWEIFSPGERRVVQVGRIGFEEIR